MGLRRPAQQVGEAISVSTIGDDIPRLSKFNYMNREIPVRVRLPREFGTDLGILQNLKLRTASGDSVPLASVATPKAVGDETSLPQPLANPLPQFPPEAVRGQWQGTVVLRLHVDALGRVARLEVQSTSGFRVLDEAATSAVRKWQFRPARRGQQAVAATVLLPVTFDL